MPDLARQQKITFAGMRAAGVRGLRPLHPDTRNQGSGPGEFEP